MSENHLTFDQVVAGVGRTVEAITGSTTALVAALVADAGELARRNASLAEKLNQATLTGFIDIDHLRRDLLWALDRLAETNTTPDIEARIEMIATRFLLPVAKPMPAYPPGLTSWQDWHDWIGHRLGR